MFDNQRDEATASDGRTAAVAVEPHVLPAAPRTSSLTHSRLPSFVTVLDAPIEALDESSQLELCAQITACEATLAWQKCRATSSFSLKELRNPGTRRSIKANGGAQLVRLGGVDTPLVSEFVATEVALAFGCSEWAARQYIALGLDLRYRLPVTNCEFGGGRISHAHALVISQETRELPSDLVGPLEARLAEAALTRTPARLRMLARRWVAKADAAALRRRRLAAHAARGVSTFAIGDGMGAFSLNHDLALIATIGDQISGWGRQRYALDPTTTPLTAHEADAASLLLLGRHPLTGHDLFSGVNDLRPATGQEATDPMVDRKAIDAQHLPPPVAEASCFLPTRTELRVHLPADALLGRADEVCDLEGIGPITADQARQLLLQSASTVLRRVFTDPADDSILFLDAHQYRFTRAQAEAIRAAHPLSVFPGSTRPARQCDIDHPIPYEHGPPDGPAPPGQTVAANGQPLHRRGHRLRTHGGWSVRQPPDDPHTYIWTSPYGRTYISQDHDGA